jgi:hypothetical protein
MRRHILAVLVRRILTVVVWAVILTPLVLFAIGVIARDLYPVSIFSEPHRIPTFYPAKATPIP